MAVDQHACTGEVEDTMPTAQEIDKLKSDWRADPCWDIEDTEGFEEHRDELAKFAAECRASWNAAYWRRVDDLAESLGIPGNRALAEHVMRLEERIERMEGIINKHLSEG